MSAAPDAPYPRDPYHRDPYPRARPASRPSSAGPLLLAALIGVGFGAGVLWFVSPHLGRDAPHLNPNAVERVADPRSPLDSDEQRAVNLFKDCKDSVVNVDTVVRVRRGLNLGVQEQQTGTGSGFVWDEDGRIVTNFHVVKDAVTNGRGLRVVMSDRSTYDGQVIGTAPDYDLAVVQISAPKDKLKKIKVGHSSDLEVGQKVFAIGNPFALSLTMTSGIISALDREIESSTDRPITGVIQTDASINPGNSGGPLLDKDGRLIGVNTAITSPSGGNVGIGFAIPVDTVNSVVTELIQRGRILKPDLGVKFVDERRLRRAGFANGVMIQEVDPNGPAAKAGLHGLSQDPQTGDVEPGDLIVAINGEEVRKTADLGRILARFKVGDKVKVAYERAEKRAEVEVMLQGV
ncbi:S1C family serine protease [Fimbriiglobus ruber]|uniref:HtrA protease/chaperone protein n=1 Tax=Fimbriiglobus ruber TaxID=1908690 RepID=A0A225E331_9BACT|nr:trypsin-like peptidase domain-containing protein [Fimbriiglobus ruber]OWK43085.1 HtrA protease/chaperone protein [Fimbriiglobus ruber]